MPRRSPVVHHGDNRALLILQQGSMELQEIFFTVERYCRLASKSITAKSWPMGGFGLPGAMMVSGLVFPIRNRAGGIESDSLIRLQVKHERLFELPGVNFCIFSRPVFLLLVQRFKLL